MLKPLFCVISLILMVSCRQADQQPASTGLPVPAYIPAPVYAYDRNLESEAFRLGRMLFYDPVLSSDSSISCGSCHAQVHAFADHGTALSSGVGSKTGHRNSPPLFNLAWNTSFMWDGGINHIEIMPLAPITNPFEMNETMPNVLIKLNRIAKYKDAFEKLYGEVPVDDRMLFETLAQFMSNLVSFQSKYDKMRQNEAVFTDEESRGYALFRVHCASCHTEPLFTDYSFAANGLDSVFSDAGRGLITRKSIDFGKFKVPSLRNVAITYPYMHDGRFVSLEQVLDHYAFRVMSGKGTDKRLPQSIGLNKTEQLNIIAFLKTLSDFSFVGITAFQEP